MVDGGLIGRSKGEPATRDANKKPGRVTLDTGWVPYTPTPQPHLSTLPPKQRPDSPCRPRSVFAMPLANRVCLEWEYGDYGSSRGWTGVNKGQGQGTGDRGRQQAKGNHLARYLI